MGSHYRVVVTTPAKRESLNSTKNGEYHSKQVPDIVTAYFQLLRLRHNADGYVGVRLTSTTERIHEVEGVRIISRNFNGLNQMLGNPPFQNENLSVLQPLDLIVG